MKRSKSHRKTRRPYRA